LAKHFNTTEQFISQTFNRPKINPDNSVESQKIKLDIDKLEVFIYVIFKINIFYYLGFLI